MVYNQVYMYFENLVMSFANRWFYGVVLYILCVVLTVLMLREFRTYEFNLWNLDLTRLRFVPSFIVVRMSISPRRDPYRIAADPAPITIGMKIESLHHQDEVIRSRILQVEQEHTDTRVELEQLVGRREISE